MYVLIYLSQANRILVRYTCDRLGDIKLRGMLSSSLFLFSLLLSYFTFFLLDENKNIIDLIMGKDKP